MSPAGVDRLRRLATLARLKADRAKADLAAAADATRRLRAGIAEVDGRIRATLAAAGDPLSARLALAHAEHLRRRRRDLMAALARAELDRETAARFAQAEEGRRIALDRLRSQAS